MSYQQITVVGHLGNNPEMRTVRTQDGERQVCNFSLAANIYGDHTIWHRVAVWGNQADACNKYLRKGSQVMVVGTVEARGYTNNAGEAAASLELRARDVRFLGAKDSAGQGDLGDYPPPADAGDIPF